MIIDSRKITPEKKYSRIVSLVPSQTELLYDLGLKDEVIGITKFCIHPDAWYKNKTRIGGTKNLRVDKIKSLNPDLVIANKEENVKEQVQELAQFFDVLVTDINDLDDALQMIKNVGALTGTLSKAITIANKIEKEFKKLSNYASGKHKTSAAYLTWKNPYMAVGGNTFINAMLPYCCLENFFADTERYPEIELKDLKIAKAGGKNCELLLLSSEPYPFKEKHVSEIKSQLPLLKIMLVDGEMFSWYGSRLLKAAEYFEKFQKKIDLIK